MGFSQTVKQIETNDLFYGEESLLHVSPEFEYEIGSLENNNFMSFKSDTIKFNTFNPVLNPEYLDDTIVEFVISDGVYFECDVFFKDLGMSTVWLYAFNKSPFVTRPVQSNMNQGQYPNGDTKVFFNTIIADDTTFNDTLNLILAYESFEHEHAVARLSRVVILDGEFSEINVDRSILSAILLRSLSEDGSLLKVNYGGALLKIHHNFVSFTNGSDQNFFRYMPTYVDDVEFEMSYDELYDQSMALEFPIEQVDFRYLLSIDEHFTFSGGVLSFEENTNASESAVFFECENDSCGFVKYTVSNEAVTSTRWLGEETVVAGDRIYFPISVGFEVYDAKGVLIDEKYDSEYTLAEKGVYLIKTQGSVFRLMK